MISRTLSRTLLLIAILAFPYWVYLPLLIAATIYFPFYVEGIVGGFLIDILYGNIAYVHVGFNFPYALVMTVVLVISLQLRDYIRVRDV